MIHLHCSVFLDKSSYMKKYNYEKLFCTKVFGGWSDKIFPRLNLRRSTTHLPDFLENFSRTNLQNNHKDGESYESFTMRYICRVCKSKGDQGLQGWGLKNEELQGQFCPGPETRQASGCGLPVALWCKWGPLLLYSHWDFPTNLVIFPIMSVITTTRILSIVRCSVMHWNSRISKSGSCSEIYI